jgi:predicted TIM-barrel fold metal-dependent hydrolase
MSNAYVDADGHVMEDAEEILKFVPAPFNNRGTRNWIPSLDHFHTPADGTPRTPGTFAPDTGPVQWLEFLDKTGTDYTVLYPTTGLAYGNVAYPRWALAYAQGYNDYIYAQYLKRSPRFQAVALIPMQSVPEAVTELRRAVKDLGFLGAMIPSNGLTRHVSHAEYWPIYEEAEKLNCGAWRQLHQSRIQHLFCISGDACPGNAISIGDCFDRNDGRRIVGPVSQATGWFYGRRYGMDSARTGSA